MPAVVLNRYRNSIGYIYGVYQVGFANQRPIIPRARFRHRISRRHRPARHQPSRRRALVRRLRSSEAHRSGRHRHARKPGRLFPRLAHARDLVLCIGLEDFRSGRSCMPKIPTRSAASPSCPSQSRPVLPDNSSPSSAIPWASPAWSPSLPLEFTSAWPTVITTSAQPANSPRYL